MRQLSNAKPTIMRSEKKIKDFWNSMGGVIRKLLTINRNLPRRNFALFINYQPKQVFTFTLILDIIPSKSSFF